jgi:MFS family permease
VSGNVWRLEAFRVLYWMHFVAAVLVPFFTQWGGLTLTEIMTLNAWFMAWTFALEIPTGAVADYFGRKWSLVLGSAVTATASLVYVSTPRYEVFLAAEVIFALGYTLVSGADEALLYDTLVATGRVEHASRDIARLNAAQMVGLVTGALGGSVIAALWGVRAPLGCQAIPITAAGLLAASLVEPTAPVGRTRTAGYGALLTSGLRRLCDDARMRIVAVDAVLVGALVWTLIWLYQPLLMRVGIPTGAFGAVHATLCLAQIAVLRSMHRLTPLVGGQARYLRAAAIIPALAMLALAWTSSRTATVALLLLAMGVGLSRMPIASSAMNARVDAAGRATLLSTVSMLRTLTICLVNPIVGALADRSLAIAMSVLGFATLAVAVFSPLRERHLAD